MKNAAGHKLLANADIKGVFLIYWLYHYISPRIVFINDTSWSTWCCFIICIYCTLLYILCFIPWTGQELTSIKMIYINVCICYNNISVKVHANRTKKCWCTYEIVSNRRDKMKSYIHRTVNLASHLQCISISNNSPITHNALLIEVITVQSFN